VSDRYQFDRYQSVWYQIDRYQSVCEMSDRYQIEGVKGDASSLRLREFLAEFSHGWVSQVDACHTHINICHSYYIQHACDTSTSVTHATYLSHINISHSYSIPVTHQHLSPILNACDTSTYVTYTTCLCDINICNLHYKWLVYHPSTYPPYFTYSVWVTCVNAWHVFVRDMW